MNEENENSNGHNMEPSSDRVQPPSIPGSPWAPRQVAQPPAARPVPPEVPQLARTNPYATYQLPPAPTPPAAPPRTHTHARAGGPGWVGLIAAMIVTALVSIGATVALVDLGGSGSAEAAGTAETAPQSGTTAPITAVAGGAQWESVAAAVRPATVSIQADGSGEVGTGSGVIIDQEGHIITNHHVVSNVLNDGTLTVILSDGRVYHATVVGADQTTDLAVIKLEGNPQNLVAARLASSDSLEVGQPVMAVGSPLGLSDTVTTGVISALDRPVVVSGQSSSGSEDNPFGQPLPGVQQQEVAEAVVTNAIQIDASINPGNSGGPLFDETGSVIGINSSIASLATGSDTAGSIGLGFAIPIDLVKNVAQQIIQTGSAQHSMLGVQISSGTTQVGEETRLGAAVAEVVGGSAADQAGLQAGDVIVGIEGNPVVSGPSLTGFVRRYQQGQTVTLEVVRDGQVQQVEVTLQAKS